MHYMHTDIHTHTYMQYIDTYIYRYIHTLHAYVRTRVHTYVRACIHTYIHTCIHTYTPYYTHIHRYVRTCNIHTYMHCIHKNMQYIHTLQTYVRACKHTYITYKHIYFNTCINTYPDTIAWLTYTEAHMQTDLHTLNTYKHYMHTLLTYMAYIHTYKNNLHRYMHI